MEIGIAFRFSEKLPADTFRQLHREAAIPGDPLRLRPVISARSRKSSLRLISRAARGKASISAEVAIKLDHGTFASLLVPQHHGPAFTSIIGWHIRAAST